ncbi:mitochondrial carrier domain-containing protein [Chytridium lagenaria]|nr:mitochondrial carrier domain-containing protein [Chytridium lagenaria]
MPETKKWDARFSGAVPHDSSCKSQLRSTAPRLWSHPRRHYSLDVTKCNMQVDPTKYRGLVGGLRTLIAEEGIAGIWKGFTPTLLGYSAQGAFKYGLYEMFKDQYSTLAGEENSKKYKGLIWCLGSASAEFFADIALCPLEMVKVKVQTSPLMSAMSAETRFPFGSLIPYTVAKFYFFEKCVQLFYTHVFTKPKESYDKLTQLGVTFASGYSAGVICAIVSHPADSLVSQLSKASNKGKSVGQIANEVGIYNLCTKGLGTRVLMIGTLTGLQWWIYDSAMGLGTTGGK